MKASVTGLYRNSDPDSERRPYFRHGNLNLVVTNYILYVLTTHLCFSILRFISVQCASRMKRVNTDTSDLAVICEGAVFSTHIGKG